MRHTAFVMNLSDRMKDLGLTDDALARAIDVSRPYVTRLRNGTRKPSIEVAAKIERLTGLPARSFASEA